MLPAMYRTHSTFNACRPPIQKPVHFFYIYASDSLSHTLELYHYLNQLMLPIPSTEFSNTYSCSNWENIAFWEHFCVASIDHSIGKQCYGSAMDTGLYFLLLYSLYLPLIECSERLPCTATGFKAVCVRVFFKNSQFTTQCRKQEPSSLHLRR